MSDDPNWLSLANHLLGAMDGEASEEFERAIGGLEADADALDSAALHGIIRGLQTTETQVASAEGDASDDDGVPWELTEVQDAYGDRIGVRIRVATSPASVDVFEGEDSLLLRTPSGDATVPIGFDYGAPEVEERDGHTSIMVRDADWEAASGALPAGDGEGRDE